MREYKILLLEDNILFADTLIDYLQSENFIVTHVINAHEMFKQTYSNKYDIYLLDINIPDLNGIETLKRLREAQDFTISIFLTSYKDKDILRSAFKNGADDYMIKPFNMDELILRIHSILKRAKNINSNIININNTIYDFDKKIFIKDSKEIILANKITMLFELFLQNNHTLVSMQTIINHIYTNNEDISYGSIRIYISKLKSILGKNTIINKKGEGYKIYF